MSRAFYITSLAWLITLQTLAQQDKCVVIDLSQSDGLKERKMIFTWNLGDGTRRDGLIVEHCYADYGTYPIRLDVRDSATGLFIRNELSTSITVSPMGLNGSELINSFAPAEKNWPPASRYLADVVHVIVSEKGGADVQQISIEADKNYFLAAQSGKNYTVLIFKGNMFFPLKEFAPSSTEKPEAISEQLLSLIRLMMKEPVQVFEPVHFALDKSIASGTELDRAIEILKANPLLAIEVGAYTHTGGRMDQNIVLAEKRTFFIRQHFINNGIDPMRISEASPEINSDLLNTCFEPGACLYEDNRLNLKAPIKIIGLMITN